MIFITVGTSQYPFDRLVRVADALTDLDDVVVQRGASAIVPSRARSVDFLDFADVVDHIRRARLVVMHAGVGSIMLALAGGKRPFVIPRRRDLDEVVDNHQFQIARELARIGRVTLVEDPDALPDLLQSAGPPSALADVAVSPLVEEVARYAALILASSRPAQE
jgi:UDP-N-acetylglucosamine transferase subunit ALG13